MKKATQCLLIVGLMGTALTLRADDGGANPIKHPEIAYDQHEVKETQKDIRQDHEKIRSTKHNEQYTKEEVAHYQTKYERDLKSYGPNNNLTKEAKANYEKAEKTYADAQQQRVVAQKSLSENRTDLNKANNELAKDKAEAKTELK